MPKKWTYEDVKAYIESEGYELLSSEYKNNNTPLEIKCPEGHVSIQTLGNFKSGKRCSICAGNKKLRYEDVRDYIESEGHTLLSQKYKNTKEKLSIKCPKGHIYEKSFSKFKDGERCIVCNNKKRANYEYVKNYLKNEGYTLLSKEIAGVKDDIKIKCPAGHVYKTTFNTFKNSGSRCPYCQKKGKYTYKEVKNKIEKNGLYLLSDTYMSCKHKLKIRCPFGHTFEKTYDNLVNQSFSCPTCSYKKAKKLSFNTVKNYIENCNYTLLSESYDSNNEKIKVMCPEGHVYRVTFGSFQQGNRCPECAKEKRADTQKLSLNKVKKDIELMGFGVVSDEYLNNRSKLHLICSKGHTFRSSYSNIMEGKGCPDCANETRGRFTRHDISFVREFIEQEGYHLLSNKYINCDSLIEIMCPEGHTYKVRFNNFYRGQRRCPICWQQSRSSKPEQEIQNLVNNLINQINCNDCSQIINPITGRKLELDVFIPSLNKAIEFNGQYWHSFDGTKERDKVKAEQCRKQGIDLLVIKEEDWLKDKEACLTQVKNFLTENPNFDMVEAE